MGHDGRRRIGNGVAAGGPGDSPLQFTELLATAIANAESRAGLARMVEEQAALRRVAMLVAEASPPKRVMAKVAEEVATLLGTHVDAAILRYGRDRAATVVAVWGEQRPTGIRVHARLPVDGSGITAKVFHEKRPVRVDNYAAADGAIADHAKDHGIRSAVGSPILVQGGLWGAIVVAHYELAPFPADTEQRVAQFTELVATAIANAAARAEVQRLADEQAAFDGLPRSSPREDLWRKSSKRSASRWRRSSEGDTSPSPAMRARTSSCSSPCTVGRRGSRRWGCVCRLTATASAGVS